MRALQELKPPVPVPVPSEVLRSGHSTSIGDRPPWPNCQDTSERAQDWCSGNSYRVTYNNNPLPVLDGNTAVCRYFRQICRYTGARDCRVIVPCIIIMRPCGCYQVYL